MKKLICVFLTLALLASLAVTVFAAGEEFYVDDSADLLTDAQELSLNLRLQAVGETYNARIYVVTVDSLDGMTVKQYAENLYDTRGYGYGDSRDGAMVLVSMEPRNYHIMGNGYVAKAMDNGDCEDIRDAIQPDLSSGSYAAAFATFADMCESCLEDYGKFDFVTNLLICLAIGLVVGLIVAFVLKGQLKTVRKQDRAAVYVRPGSMNLTVNRDLYLYSTVRRIKRPTNNSGSQGGGGSRSGASGSF